VILELACLAIVALFVAVRSRRDPSPRAFMARLGLLALASFLAEDTVIRAYGFYAYETERWSLFLDRVPLMIVLIWPVVIHSAWDLSRHVPGPRVWIASAIVLFDASLIEPIAVRAGLWRWTEPGLFDVPPIGVFGWAVFAFFAILCFERGRGALAPIIATAGSHLVLVASWWIFFRWVNVDLPAWPFVVALWCLSIALVRFARTSIPRIELGVRIPAALFFFALLALYGRSEPALVSYALAFAPPYLAQMLIVQKPPMQT
jgi:uncharacterized membrane protein